MLSVVADEGWYVATDTGGVQYEPGGRVSWSVPQHGMVQETRRDEGLVLRRPAALLDALDEWICQAEPLEPAAPAGDGEGNGVARVRAARLLRRCAWDPTVACGFAIDCAEHVLGDAASVTLPGGITLAQVLSDARRAVADGGTGRHEHLGYFARLSALRRLEREQRELAGLEQEVILDDERRDLDVLDDPDYETVAPLVDSVLAAIEALRHHVLPHLYTGVEDRAEESEEHRAAEGQLDEVTRHSVLVSTPLGAAEVGSHTLRYEPAWTSAMLAARHARQAARDSAGVAGERAERQWQAAKLAALLAGSSR